MAQRGPARPWRISGGWPDGRKLALALRASLRRDTLWPMPVPPCVQHGRALVLEQPALQQLLELGGDFGDALLALAPQEAQIIDELLRVAGVQ